VRFTKQIATIEAHKAKEEGTRRAEAAAKSAGFIALSESSMNWSDAKAFCQQQGGRLPRINDSDLLARADRNKITHTDGFGALGAPWPPGLPSDWYWTGTGTELTDASGYSWIVGGRRGSGSVYVTEDRQSQVSRVVCVP